MRCFVVVALTLGAGLLRADAPRGASGDTSAVRQALKQVIDRPAVALSPTTRPMPDRDGLLVTHLVITAEPGQTVPALILESRPVTKKPAVILLHGTGGHKEDNLPLATTLAKRGFVAVVLDGRYHGERCRDGKGSVDYFAAISQAYADGKSHPWLFDTVYDVTRMIDYLQTRDDVDANRIGLMGISKGGMECYLTAAYDDRVAVAVPCISAQSFAWGLTNDAWHKRVGTVQGAFDQAAKYDGVDTPDAAFVKKFYDRLLPGIDGILDGPSVIPTIRPRPLLTINGETDGINPLPGVKLVHAATAAAYEQAGVGDHFVGEIEIGTRHDVTAEYRSKAVEWFVRWLKPAGN